jgi:hypothetical protein
MSDENSSRGRKAPSGTLGNLESLGLPEIVQSLALARKTARLSLTSNGRWGHIWLEDGTATHAQTHKLSGELAFYEMVTWKTGQFMLEPDVRTDSHSLEHDPMFLVMEGSRRLDEAHEPEESGDGSSSELETIPLSRPALKLADPSQVAPNRPPRPPRPGAESIKPNRSLQLSALPHDRGGWRRMWLLAATIAPLCAFGLWLPSLGVVAPPGDRWASGKLPTRLGGAEAIVEDVEVTEDPAPLEKPSAPIHGVQRDDGRSTIPAAADVTGEASRHDVSEPLDLSDVVFVDASPGAIAPARYGQTFDGSLGELANRAVLIIEGKSSVRSGTLSVRIDGTEVYSRVLSIEPESQKLFKRMFGKSAETFETTIPIEPGEHEIQALVTFDDDARGFGSSAVLNIRAGATRQVKLVAGRKPGSPTLKIE